MTEITEWNWWPQVDHALETSDSTIRVEVRIWSDRGEMYVEPLYYAVYSKDDQIVMDGAKASAECDRMWRFINHLVHETYNANRLAEIQNEHPAFESDRIIARQQLRLDIEWDRSTKL